MAILSRGYQGEVGWSAWAEYAGRMGGKYSVATPAAWKVTANSAGVRQVSIAPGVAVGAGIHDTNDAVLNYTLPEVLSGSRWYLVGIRRRWGSGLNVSAPFHVAGATGTAVPVALPARASTPGLEDFQPLALVRVEAGKPVPQAVLDLRVWSTLGGTVGAPDAPQLVRQYITEVGSRVTFGREDWQVQVDGAGNPAWVQLNAPLGQRPYLCVRRMAAFGGSVVGGSVPFYAGRDADHIKLGAWSDHLEYSNGASGAASPISATAPAYIRTKTDGTYAYGAFVDMESISNHSVMAFSADIDQDAPAGTQGQIDPYHQNYVLAGERVMWTLSATLWLPAGARLHPSFGKASGATQLHRWQMWMTRLGD